MKKKVVSLLVLLSAVLLIISPTNVFAGQADDIISKASGEVGYLETTYSNGSFWSKYGEWYGIPNGAWCAMFVSWCANKAGISTGIVPKFASVGVGVDWFKNKGQWKARGSYTPKKGDIIFFGTSSHVGLVEKVSGNTVYTIEGNVHDGSGKNYGVRRLNYSLSNTYIQGYGVPKYSGTEPQPANLGDNFYAVILHKDSWKPISYDDDGYVRLRTETGTANQVWRFVRQSDGAYVIASTKNNKLLELTAGDTTNGKQASVGGEDWGGYYQRWYLYEYGGGYIIQSKHYTNLNRVLDLDNSNTNDGTAILTYQRNNGRNQVWAIYQGDEIKMKSPQLEVKTEKSVTTLNWNDIYGELSYFVHIYKDGLLYKETVIPYGQGCSYSESLPDGNYTAYVAAHNAFYAKDSNTVSFSVLNGEKAPDTWIKADKNTYYVGDSVVFNFGYKYTTSVSLGIDKDGKRYANPEVTGKTSYSYLLPETGTYSVYVSGWSQSGYQDSKRIEITVKERPPEINSSIETYSNSYIVKTGITSLKQSAVYVTVLYSEEGELLDIQTLSLSSDAVTADIALPKHPDAKYIKVFLWDSLDNMEPLCDSETITL